MPNFCAEEIVSARDAIRIEARFFDHSRYFRTECIGATLVCVEDENPGRRSFLDRGVALQPNRGEWMGQQLSAAVSRERRRIVGRSILDDDDLASPANAVDARSDVVRFVACSNYDSDANCRLAARGYRRPSAASNESTIAPSGNSLATRAFAADPIACLCSSLASKVTTLAAVVAASS